MDETGSGSMYLLFLLSLVMFCGSYLAGQVPLWFRLSERHLRLLSAFGAGLLMGTALVVIIPEGIQTLYTAYSDCPSTVAPPTTSNQTLTHGPDGLQHASHPTENISAHVGIALVLGFGLMLIVDQISSVLGGHASHSTARTRLEPYPLSTTSPPASSHSSQTQLNQAHIAMQPLPTGDVSAVESNLKRSSLSRGRNGSSAAFVGLILHCIADGIAMGAASSTHQSQLEILVFAAILLHKAPSAFALTTYLMTASSFSSRQIRQKLLIFSAVAPLASLVSALFFSSIQFDHEGTLKWSGTLLLFSGGSFLYVAAVHVLPETLHQHDDHHRLPKVNGKQMLAVACVSMFLPLLLTAGGHGH